MKIMMTKLGIGKSTILLARLCALIIFSGAATSHATLAQSPPKGSTPTAADSARKVAAPPAAQERRPSMRELVMKPVVYSVAGMDRVRVRQNLKYTDTADANLLMDVYAPPDAAQGERRPAVLFIHGGAGSQFTPKDWGVYTSWGRLVAASGMVGVTFAHRLGYPKPLLAESAHDVTDAIKYVRDNAETLGVDKDRICLAAYSAGGPMLSLAMRDKLPYVRCLVAFYAFLDIQQSDTHRQNETPEMVRAFSPVNYLAEGADKLPPIFVARAGLDQVPTMNDSIDRFVREAFARNAAVTVVNHPRGVHGFDNQTDDERSREIVRGVIEFMRTRLGVAPAEDEGHAEQELMRLERDWSAAYLRHDAGAVERIVADDFVGIDGRGVVSTKADEIKEVRGSDPAEPPPFVVLDETVTDMKVRRYGETAVVTGRTIERVKTKDREGEIQYRRTTVWVRRGGRWQCVSFHGSRIMTPPPGG